MQITTLTSEFSVTGQITPEDVSTIADLGFKTVINNRPEGESGDQPAGEAIAAACEAQGLKYVTIPIVPNGLDESHVDQLAAALDDNATPALAFCRTGNRSSMLWNAMQQRQHAPGSDQSDTNNKRVQALIIGGGAGGIATAASLQKRDSSLSVAIIEPKETHAYQPGWTLVGGGVFNREETLRPMASVIPRGVEWIRDAVVSFDPENNEVTLAGGGRVRYDALIVSPGIKLDWDRVEGLRDTLGQNGVTSNYDIEYATRTWENIRALKSGRALFTQPPMPIKCAGAPQKAMYLAADHWLRNGVIKDIDIDFYNAGGVLFGVPDYVPALEGYVDRYDINLNFNRNLVAVDGPAKKAFFSTGESSETIAVEFDMMHVSPPQCAPDFIRNSPIANEAGWVDVDQHTLQHTRYDNIFGLGDGCSTPNAKTAAAVRKQAPVVAHNVLSLLADGTTSAQYDGYGSCPLIVERGKVVLAEFGYGGALQPTLPQWMLDGKRATRAGWLLKAGLLPTIYFDLMLKGKEWLASPAVKTGDGETIAAGAKA